MARISRSDGVLVDERLKRVIKKAVERLGSKYAVSKAMLYRNTNCSNINSILCDRQKMIPRWRYERLLKALNG